MLTQKILKELLDYDPIIGVFTWRKRDRIFFHSERSWKMWNSRYSCKEAGCEKTSYGKKYLSISLLNKLYKAHRLAWLHVTGSFPVNEIDHIDGFGTNNRLINLRDVTHSVNGKNQRLPANNTSGLAGVYWFKKTNKWYARITADYKQINLGYFDDWFEAVCARKSAQLKYDFHPNHGSKRPL